MLGMLASWRVTAAFKALGVEAYEVDAVKTASGCFTLILASYFITVPLRDEMGVLLGTSTLPKLVGSSLLLSMVFQAATSSLLDTSRHASVTKAAALRTLFRRLAFCIFLFAFAVLLTADVPHATYLDASSSVVHLGRGLRQTVDVSGGVSAGVGGALLPPPAPPSPTPPALPLWEQGGVGTGVGVGVGVGHAHMHAHREAPPHGDFSVVLGDATLSQPRRILFIVFYLWMGIQNLLAGSVMWARCADVFPAASAPRVFGVIAAAATFGQLLGAVVVQLLSRSVSGRMPAWLQGLLLAMSAACMLAVSLLVSRLEPVRVPPAQLRLDVEALEMPQAPMRARTPSPRRTVEAFTLIARSATLRHLSLHLVCSYLISSLLYFTRSAIFASALKGSGSRLRWFSAGNALSAVFVLLLQLFATGGAIRSAGVAVALVSVPVTCCVFTIVLAFQPVPAVLVLAETARKVVSYSFSKPAREMLFTQLSSDVKYKSKLVLDTVVQRGGDALGAALFSALDAHQVSSSSLAAACSVLSLFWAAVAFTLGTRFDRRLRRSPLEL